MTDDDLSPAERAVVDRFEAADPAPESFDATAALRRVLALADEWATTPANDTGLAAYAAMRRIRAVLRGDW